MIKKYRTIVKEQGWKGLIKQEGWKVAVLLFLFFLLKGLLWLAIFYGAFELFQF